MQPLYHLYSGFAHADTLGLILETKEYDEISRMLQVFMSFFILLLLVDVYPDVKATMNGEQLLQIMHFIISELITKYAPTLSVEEMNSLNQIDFSEITASEELNSFWDDLRAATESGEEVSDFMEALVREHFGDIIDNKKS
ncbi:hypothetical protein ACFSOY_00445 [Tumebacillus lipolyticus]|uniref:Uncharacterized protein n=2 Tax=Tumebacillus lipolyticus TaxID=1280370 RepID=A0ABW4ZSM7_9BACL